MSNTCPVVTIIRDGVEVRINESDYDPKIHKLTGFNNEPPMPPEALPLEEMSATQLREYAKENDIDIRGLKSKDDLLKAVKGTLQELFVFPNSEGKFIIVDSEGNKVTDEIFETQEEAEKAILGE